MCERRILLPTARNGQYRANREQPAVGDKIREEREESCEKLVTYNEELTSNQRGAYCDQRLARGEHPDARGVPWWGVANNAQHTESNEKRTASHDEARSKQRETRSKQGAPNNTQKAVSSEQSKAKSGYCRANTLWERRATRFITEEKLTSRTAIT